jgi:RHS repeat-associated protein
MAVLSKIFSTVHNRYGYQGKEMQNQEWTDGSGLNAYDFEARMYDPQLGVWHNQDPAGQYASPYMAMGDNWVNGIDPTGTKSFWNTLGTIGEIVGAAALTFVTAGTALPAIVVAAGGYAGASLESGSWNPGHWTGDAGRGAITGERVAGSLYIGGEDAFGGNFLSDELGVGGAHIAESAAGGVATNLAATEVGDIAFGQYHQNLTWQEAFVASITGGITGAFGGLNPTDPVVGISNGVQQTYFGMGLRTTEYVTSSTMKILENQTLYNLASSTGGSIISSLLNGSLKLNIPLGPIPFNVTLGKHQNLLQIGPNIGGVFYYAKLGLNAWMLSIVAKDFEPLIKYFQENFQTPTN